MALIRSFPRGSDICQSRRVDAFTINQARAYFLEDETGSIEIGKSADMVVVDKNITAIYTKDIGTATVRMTLFKGKKVYELCG